MALLLPSSICLHTPPVLPACFVKRAGDLPERADARGIDQDGENIAVLDNGLLEAFEHGAGGGSVALLEGAQADDPRALFRVGRARQLDLDRRVALEAQPTDVFDYSALLLRNPLGAMP